MGAPTDATIPLTRRPRKSTGHSPVRKRMEKENITVDVASSLAGNGSRKKSRSKSIGPGGLDVLKSGTGNRRMSLAVPSKPPPRSILKPTMPQLQEIPPHKSKTTRRSPPTGTVQGFEKLHNPFQTDDAASSGTKVSLRTEEEQQAAAREREERERKQLEKEITDRREARRKSLANRRVSFAAEATLHTFHEIEYNQDSTTSTDTTRRASQARDHAGPADTTSTPPEITEDLLSLSPEEQRSLHERNQPGNSGMPAFQYGNHQDDVTLASSIYSSDSEVTEGMTEVHEDTGSVSGSESEADGVTMDLDADEMTGTSVASAWTARSGFSEYDNDTLDEALELATRRAEAQRIDEEEEVIPSFGWVKKPGRAPAPPVRERQNPSSPDHDDIEETSVVDMEITNVVGGIIRSRDDTQSVPQDEEMSMDVTRALGGILPPRGQAVTGNQSPEGPPEDDSAEEATMEFTTAIGGIRGALRTDEPSEIYDEEDMSMELTTVMGGLVSTNKMGGAKRRVSLARRRTLAREDEATMDMTVGLGRILPAHNKDNVDDEPDATIEMDMTTAVGKIINAPARNDQTQARQVMEREVDIPDGHNMTRSPPNSSPPESISGRTTLEADSPGSLPLRGGPLRHSIVGQAPETPLGKSPKRNKAAPEPVSPVDTGFHIPSEQSSPVKTPASLASPIRAVSPKRALTNQADTTPKSPTRRTPRLSIFEHNPTTGVTTPQVLLTPLKRQLSGIGVDRPGLGSPKVAAILERRGSIGETAGPFIPQEGFRAVTFEDPQFIEDELDKEHRQGELRGSTYSHRDDEDDENNTATLKDMISSMTPKKKNLKGRKSLHVGSASGLLGKRPAELDDDEDDDDYDRDGVKRLKNHQSSPVKNVRLRAPPTKEETTGRSARSIAKMLGSASADSLAPPRLFSPNKGTSPARSPQRNMGRFIDAPTDQPTSTFTFHDTISLPYPETTEGENGDRIHLQEFLDLTSIRFMELTTTKRRHTQAPMTQRGMLPGKEDLSLERCVVAGACTVPMLELYQHSCRELKKYISEGRRIVREIEMETFEENPPLFKEYMSATPEFKSLMDNQFKNVKTHARLLSKAMWYEWRMKLQDGLKEGLVNIAEGMLADEELLVKQQTLLDSIVPELSQRFDSLTKEHENLEAVAQELADCDPEDLQFARTELTSLDSAIETKQRKLEELRKTLNETESKIDQAAQTKQSCVAEIREAEKVREECRGWTSNEINSLKAKVDDLEKRHGWAIKSVAGTNISMTYRREIELVFDVSSFVASGGGSNSPIELSYIAANRDRDPQPTSPEKEFFVRCIRDHVRDLTTKAHTKIHTVLHTVSEGWEMANHVARNVRLLNCTFPTKVTRTSDSSIAVRSSLLLAPLETKVEITLDIHGKHSQSGFQVSIVPRARVVYGEHFKVENVAEFLATHIETSLTTSEQLHKAKSWSDVVVELHEKLLARGRK
ncbi:Spc7-domain-containing protein [Poronia punctata]|nr:Spc7-domain-containing protein [Poronia punctata]